MTTERLLILFASWKSLHLVHSAYWWSYWTCFIVGRRLNFVYTSLRRRIWISWKNSRKKEWHCTIISLFLIIYFLSKRKSNLILSLGTCYFSTKISDNWKTADFVCLMETVTSGAFYVLMIILDLLYCREETQFRLHIPQEKNLNLLEKVAEGRITL